LSVSGSDLGFEMAHKVGQSREQMILFPESLDEAVGRDHPVRVIDAFVDSLDLGKLGFSKVVAEATGRPPYAPGDLLKLYVYGYQNRTRSSRRLEAEAARNIEVMWLTRRAAPAFKTIADFRKDHAKPIIKVCRAFVQFCREQSLVGGKVLAIDGTKINAVASPKRVITPQSLKHAAEAVDRKIAAYLAGMDEADREENGSDAPQIDVAAALAALKQRRVEIEQQAEELKEQGLSQLVVTEPEAKLMRTAGCGHQVSYNVQTVVDAEHKLVVAFDLTNEGNDQCQLHPMAVAGKEAVGGAAVTVVADTGYSNGEHGQKCADDQIIAIVPRAETVNPMGKQYFARDRFSYDQDGDTWRCPAGKTLTCRDTNQAQQRKKYWTNECRNCPLKPDCTKSGKRVIVRHFFEDAREAMHRRATADSDWMKLRRCTVEHPYGTIKWMMGHPRFLVRGLKKAKSELALSVLAYNLKRVISIMGVHKLLAALQATPA
jgi:transposase